MGDRPIKGVRKDAVSIDAIPTCRLSVKWSGDWRAGPHELAGVCEGDHAPADLPLGCSIVVQTTASACGLQP